VLETLRSDPKLADWLRELEAADLPGPPPALPGGEDLADALLDLAVPHEEIGPLLAHRDAVLADADLHWLLERTVRLLASRIGTVGDRHRLPMLPESWGAAGRYLYVYAFVALAPHTRAYHAERGVPEDVSRHTLADIGRQVAVHRRRYGFGGLLHPNWLTLHLRGELYQLGRLQFQRARLGSRTGQAVGTAGLPLGPGDPNLELHIPDFLGPFSPQACDRSLERARRFFAEHYPQERYRVATCYSWLLDPQLARYLPADSNIVRFQRRFRIVHPGEGDYDRETIDFVFGDPDLPLDRLPRDTTLQRAVADHIRGGEHWNGARGWFEL
jgi:hypothetical protein